MDCYARIGAKWLAVRDNLDRERGRERMSMATAIIHRSPTESSHSGIVELDSGSDSELESYGSDDDNEEFVPMSESESGDQAEEGYLPSSPSESVGDDAHTNESALRSSLYAGQERVTDQCVSSV